MPAKTIPRHVIFKVKKIKNKEKFLKEGRGKNTSSTEEQR